LGKLSPSVVAFGSRGQHLYNHPRMLDKLQRRQILGMAGRQQVRGEESPTILNTDLYIGHIFLLQRPLTGGITDYRHLASLQEYMVVCQSRPQVEVFRHNAEGLWVLYCYSAGEPVVLTSVDSHGTLSHRWVMGGL